MEWYSIRTSTDENVTGTLPQADGMKSGYNIKKNDSVWNVPNLKMPNFNPDLDYFILEKKATLTDIISVGFISASGFLVTDKVKKILDAFKLPLHKYFSAKVMYQREIHPNYYWLHFLDDNSKDIDFLKSEFELTHPLPFFRESSIILKNKEYNVISANAIANPTFVLFPLKMKILSLNNYDFFLFDFLYPKYIINNLIINELKKRLVTGLDLQKLNNDVIV